MKRIVYTDPGSGLLLLQILSGAFAGLLFYASRIRRLLAAVKAKFLRG